MSSDLRVLQLKIFTGERQQNKKNRIFKKHFIKIKNLDYFPTQNSLNTASIPASLIDFPVSSLN